MDKQYAGKGMIYLKDMLIPELDPKQGIITKRQSKTTGKVQRKKEELEQIKTIQRTNWKRFNLSDLDKEIAVLEGRRNRHVVAAANGEEWGVMNPKAGMQVGLDLLKRTRAQLECEEPLELELAAMASEVDALQQALKRAVNDYPLDMGLMDAKFAEFKVGVKKGLRLCDKHRKAGAKLRPGSEVRKRSGRYWKAWSMDLASKELRFPNLKQLIIGKLSQLGHTYKGPDDVVAGDVKDSFDRWWYYRNLGR